MRNGRITLFVAAAVMLGLAGTTWARDPQVYTEAPLPTPVINWKNPASAPINFDWSDPNNWTGAVVPGIVGGAANTTAQFEQWAITNDVNIKVNEAVDTGTGDIYIRLNSGGPDMYINGTGSLKCSTYWVRQSRDYVITQVPLEATTMVVMSWRWGSGRFENTVKTPIVRIGDGIFTFAAHDGNDQMDAVQMWKDREGTIPQMYQYNAIDPYVPGTPLSILIDDGGIYGGYVDGAFGTLAGNSASLIQGSTLIVGAAQTNFPSVEVVGGSVLAGYMTGLTSADFGLAGDGKKVTFAADSVYAPAPGGAEPTRAAMGGAILIKGIYNTSAAGTTTVGDDGSTTLYKAAAFGAFGTSSAINTTVAVLPNIGNLQIYVTGRNADLGAGTTLESVTTKAVDFVVPNGAANVSLVGGAINNGDLTGAKATSFNFRGQPVQHDTILRFLDAGGEIATGQTFNVKDGLVGLDTSSNTTFLKGTLEIDAGGALYNGNYWAEPGDSQWFTPLSASGGTIVFKDRGLLFLPPGQEGIFENVNVTASGTPYVVLGSGPWGETPSLPENYNLTAAGTPKMLGLLKASNLWISADYDYVPVNFAGEGVTVGNGKWIQGIDGTNRSSKVAGTIRAEPGTTIGFAGIADSFTVDASIVASGATVRFNTTDTLETCVYVNSVPSGNAHTNNRLLGVVPSANVIVNGMITAQTIKAQNGTLTLNQDLNVPNLDIAGIATVTMATGKKATVTGTLSGTGKLTGGLGMTVAAGGKVAPGNSNGIGVLNDGGGVLTFDYGAIYKWQVAETGGVAGAQWDLVKGSTINFLGDLILEIDVSLLAGSIDGTESFVVASALSSMGALGSYSFLGDWVGDLAVVGNDLVLSNVGLNILPGDTNDDFVVDAADFVTLKKNFGAGVGGGETVGNFDNTGTVDWADLSTLMTNMGVPGPAPATTPEPATLGLLAIGALAMLRRRRV